MRGDATLCVVIFTPCFLILQYMFCVILLVILQFSVIRNVTEFCNITLFRAQEP